MKLNKGCPLFRYEIARILNMNEKKLYRLLRKKNFPLEPGMVMPADLDKIEALVLGDNGKEEQFTEGEKYDNLP